MTARGIDRVRCHAAGVTTVARALRRRGCQVTRHGRNDGVSLTVQAPGGIPLAVAVRVAQRRLVRHAVRVGGRRYEYRYPELRWNLHVHGRRLHRPDWWVLVVAGERRTYVVPSHALGTAVTVFLLDTPTARHGRARVRPYLRAWAALVAASAGREAA